MDEIYKHTEILCSCGGVAELQSDGGYSFYVQCTECKSRSPHNYSTKVVAVYQFQKEHKTW